MLAFCLLPMQAPGNSSNNHLFERGKSWCVLGSWYKVGGPEQQFLHCFADGPNQRLSFICNIGYKLPGELHRILFVTCDTLSTRKSHTFELGGIRIFKFFKLFSLKNCYSWHGYVCFFVLFFISGVLSFAYNLNLRSKKQCHSFLPNLQIFSYCNSKFSLLMGQQSCNYMRISSNRHQQWHNQSHLVPGNK